jgi:hypothetical protein
VSILTAWSPSRRHQPSVVRMMLMGIAFDPP